MIKTAMNIWTIYAHPLDYPDNFVARRWVMLDGGKFEPTTDIIIADTLDIVRSKLPPGLFRIERFETDEPQVVEAWM